MHVLCHGCACARTLCIIHAARAAKNANTQPRTRATRRCTSARAWAEPRVVFACCSPLPLGAASATSSYSPARANMAPHCDASSAVSLATWAAICRRRAAALGSAGARVAALAASATAALSPARVPSAAAATARQYNALARYRRTSGAGRWRPRDDDAISSRSSSAAAALQAAFASAWRRRATYARDTFSSVVTCARCARSAVAGSPSQAAAEVPSTSLSCTCACQTGLFIA